MTRNGSTDIGRRLSSTTIMGLVAAMALGLREGVDPAAALGRRFGRIGLGEIIEEHLAHLDVGRRHGMLLRHPVQRVVPAAAIHALPTDNLERMTADAIAEGLFAAGEIRKRFRRLFRRRRRLRRGGGNKIGGQDVGKKGGR